MTAADVTVLYTGLIVSRAEARLSGLSKYFTGGTCRRGHVSQRWTVSAICDACLLINTRNYRQINKSKVAEWDKRAAEKRNAEIPEVVRTIKARYREKNRDEIRAAGRAYASANRERSAEYHRGYRRSKPWKAAEYQRTRETIKRSAMPSWADRKKIQAVYIKAQAMTDETGIKHSVDHIYPIQGATVCGLHVHYNLQVIPLTDNLSKGNKMPDEWRRKSELETK